ncbi:MAG: NAD(P)-dependent oxidoreductase [Pseudomonadota bacterium]
MRIAFLGLGKMGAGMAARLVEAGHEVTVWNRSPAAGEALVDMGAAQADTPAAAATGAEAVFSMVADDPASETCWDGASGALGVLEAGAFVIECSTISVDRSRALAKACAAKGLRYLDCPVNGPPAGARKGELTLLVGAEAADLDAARPILEPLATSILHFGGQGAGTAYKLINNLLGAVHVSAMAEAAALAREMGIDPDVMSAAVEGGPIGSPHAVRMCRPMLERRPADSFGLAIGLREKDSRYCLAMARSAGVQMPVGESAYAWYAQATPKHGDQDDSLMLETILEGPKG